ncbi:hypothetical protein PXD04_07995 [Methanosphaera sp. ISO3-F5]|uniref:hypothetical protein n=1 Tax=Methanosphaera sp. ISO3-F5 TaxID=1452353 RepID=UPI002B2635C9|nr:hypothetical protein [Methanosphaera sp. ISO3-F5]WQH63636.1 hypothetical protein PXD04_07995 [Methanosphaera sp. ISO3-F5]
MLGTIKKIRTGLLLANFLKDEIINQTVKFITDEPKLMKIIKNDSNTFIIREIATKQITDNELLKEIIFDTSKTSYTKNVFDLREIAAKQVTDEETLTEIVDKYYDKTIKTKYGLNVVKSAIEQINDEDKLMTIVESNYDEEIRKLALTRINNKYEEPDLSELRTLCDDDIKVKRMHAIDKINDEETLIDIAMNANYMDVREKAVNKIKTDDTTINILKHLITQEKEYNKIMSDYITTNQENEENKQEIIRKANNLGVQYKKIGNTKKEKFYNQQSKLLKNK